MSEDTSYGRGVPNRNTRVNTMCAGYTIVASVRLHSDGGFRGVEEDRMVCLAVHNETGEMVSWDSYWVGEMMDSNRFGWSSGRYQPYRGTLDTKNNAIEGFKDRVNDELVACIARAETRQEKVVNRDLEPTIDTSMPDEEE